MVKTLAQLEKENEKLKNQLKAKQEMLELGRKRNELLRENRSLMRQAKYGGVYRFGRKAGSVGKKVGKGLLQIAKNIEENQRREQMLQRKQSKTLKRVSSGRKKTTPKKRTIKKKSVRRSRK